jgi:hypothetical protein
MSKETSIKIINVFGRAIPTRLLGIDQSLYFKRWSKNRAVAYFSLGLEAAIKTVVPFRHMKPHIKKSTSLSQPEVWTVQIPDSLLLQGVKNLAAFRASLEEEYDFLVTSITSTYINLSKLAEYLHQAEQNNFIGGRIEKSGKMQYQQGSFRVFSRDVVENIVKNSNRYKHWLIEDIAMGRLLNENYFEFTNVENTTIESLEDISTLLESELSNYISYRCKASAEGQRIDHLLMQSLNERLI